MHTTVACLLLLSPTPCSVAHTRPRTSRKRRSMRAKKKKLHTNFPPGAIQPVQRSAHCVPGLFLPAPHAGGCLWPLPCNLSTPPPLPRPQTSDLSTQTDSNYPSEKPAHTSLHPRPARYLHPTPYTHLHRQGQVDWLSTEWDIWATRVPTSYFPSVSRLMLTL